jgi:catechol 2,3-dioxygenase-like lactoylglutathione lyase family enzyme
MSVLPSSSRLGPIDLITIVVPLLDHAVAVWSGGLGLQLLAGGQCPDGLALALGRRDLAGARYAALGMHGLAQLRLIEAIGKDPAVPRGRPGWQAIGLAVADLEAAHALARRAGFRPLADSSDQPAGPWLRTAALAGPAGEGVDLVQIRQCESARADDPPCCMVSLASRHPGHASGFFEGLGASERLLDADSPVGSGGSSSEADGAQPSTLLHLVHGHLIEIAAWPNTRALAPVTACGLLSVRFGRPGRPRGTESQLSQPCRVLGGPEGELIELL